MESAYRTPPGSATFKTKKGLRIKAEAFPNNKHLRPIKNAQVQGARSLRSEAYRKVRRSVESEGNAADGRFSSAV